MLKDNLCFETLYDTYGQHVTVDRVLFEAGAKHQHLVIFENKEFGRMMALDGVIQPTERDEFIYQEVLIHAPCSPTVTPSVY